MNKDQYAQILKSELGYQTPSGSSLVANYLPVWPRSLIYYIKLISTLTYASFSARRGSLDDDRWAFHSHRAVQIVESVGGKVNISGLEALSQQPGPVVCIGNHMSLLETLMMPGIVLAFNRVNFVMFQFRLKSRIVFGRFVFCGQFLQCFHQGLRYKHAPEGSEMPMGIRQLICIDSSVAHCPDLRR